MSSSVESETQALERIYQEASQWVRLVNTIIWSMGTLLVPVSFGLLGVALNKTSGFQFDLRGKIVLGVGSVFLFSFWVYASRIYKESVQVARAVLIEIEQAWGVEPAMSLYRRQQPILNQRFQKVRFLHSKKRRFLRFKKLRSLKIPHGLFLSQKITLAALILVWILIVWWRL